MVSPVKFTSTTSAGGGGGAALAAAATSIVASISALRMTFMIDVPGEPPSPTPTANANQSVYGPLLSYDDPVLLYRGRDADASTGNTPRPNARATVSGPWRSKRSRLVRFMLALRTRKRMHIVSLIACGA